LPKRPPTAVEFDPQNKLHQNMIAAYATLLARSYKILIPYENPRSAEAKQGMAE